MPDRILTDDQVIEIHRRVSNGETHISVAKSIGISRNVVTGIARGKIYKRFNLTPTQKREPLGTRDSSIAEKILLSCVEDNKTGYLEWTRALSFHGYGVIRINGRNVGAHRVAYELKNRPIPKGLFVLHNCDNPRCCNPDHLRVGTQAENMKDVKIRFRGAIGERAKFAKLQSSDVLEILALYEKGHSVSEISLQFNVTRPSIKNVINGKTWRHISNK